MAHVMSTIADDNSFDKLSVHSGGSPSPIIRANGVSSTQADDMEVDPSVGSDNEPRLSAAAKGKQKAARVRSASEAGLSPPPPPSRPFVPSGDNDHAILGPEADQSFSPNNIMENDASDNEEGAAPRTGPPTGFMADARHPPAQTPADRAVDYLLAVTLQEEDSRPQRKTAAATRSGAGTKSYSAAVSKSTTHATAGEPRQQTTASFPTKPFTMTSSAHAFSATPSSSRTLAAPTAGPSGKPASSTNGPTTQRAQSLPGELAPWLAFTYSGSDEPDELVVAVSKDVTVGFWPPNYPVPRGVTFESITAFLSDSNRAAWRSLPGYILIAYPADAAHTNVDDFVYCVRLVCALVFGDAAAIKVFPADVNGQFHAPVALLRCATRAQFIWLRNQQVINNSRRPFFVISRDRPPARITHTVTGGGWEDDQDSRDSLVGLYRSAVRASEDVRTGRLRLPWLPVRLDTISPLPVFKKNTRIPVIYWRVECARMTLDESAVRDLNRIIRKLQVHDDIYGTPQVVQALHCGMCGSVYHMFGKCIVANAPAWLGVRPRTEDSDKKTNAGDDEDRALPNAGMRIAAALIKDAPFAGKKGGKPDKKGKGKKN